LIKLCKIVYRE